MQIGIIEPNGFSNKAVKKISNIGSIEFFDNKNLRLFLNDKEIIFIRLKYYIGKNFLDLSKELKYICTPTTGLNHIDLDECIKRDIKIISLKGEHEFLSTIRATPEHTFGLVLALLRKYKTAFLSKNNDKWDRDKYKGFELFENKIGIIGFGRVGKILSKYFKAFDAKVYFYDIDGSVQSVNDAIKASSIVELVDKTNVIILCASYTEGKTDEFDKKFIDLLKNKYFINTARGELLDESYLIKKIKEGYFKGIAIDVIQSEQSKDNNLKQFLRLVETNNFIVTSHIAGATFGSMHRTEEFIADKLIIERT